MPLDPLTVAKVAVHEASTILLDHYQHLRSITTKSAHRDLVTEADKAAEQKIHEVLLNAFPEHTMLGEEGEEPDPNASYRWIVDPIDGTTNYVHGFPHFCTSIALYHEAVAQVGVVYEPLRQELFAAERGKGATLNGRPITVSKRDDLRGSLVVTGFPYDRENQPVHPYELFDSFIREVRDLRRTGSAALDLCWVASGRLDGYFEVYLGPWDAAAGVLIVQEAGGKVTDLWGGALDLYECRITASNGLIHEQMVKVVRKQFGARKKAE